jgi:hypothetical protein
LSIVTNRKVFIGKILGIIMTEDRYTPEGLPKPSTYLVEVFFRDYFKRAKEGTATKFFEEIALRIKDTNPGLSSFFDKLFTGMDSKKAESYAMGAGCMYELLRRQAESDQLDRKNF